MKISVPISVGELFDKISILEIKKIKIKDSERSLISETVSIEGTINSSGAIDVAGLIKGPVYSKELIVRDTGSITGTIEADDVEIHGHLDGKVSAQNIVIGATGTVKGDIEFGNKIRPTFINSEGCKFIK